MITRNKLTPTQAIGKVVFYRAVANPALVATMSDVELAQAEAYLKTALTLPDGGLEARKAIKQERKRRA